MKKYSGKILSEIAKENGYEDKESLLYDYSIMPTVRTPQHKKREFAALLLKHIKRRE